MRIFERARALSRCAQGAWMPKHFRMDGKNAKLKRRSVNPFACIVGNHVRGSRGTSQSITRMWDGNMHTSSQVRSRSSALSKLRLSMKNRRRATVLAGLRSRSRAPRSTRADIGTVDFQRKRQLEYDDQLDRRHPGRQRRSWDTRVERCSQRRADHHT